LKNISGRGVKIFEPFLLQKINKKNSALVTFRTAGASLMAKTVLVYYP